MSHEELLHRLSDSPPVELCGDGHRVLLLLQAAHQSGQVEEGINLVFIQAKN